MFGLAPKRKFFLPTKEFALMELGKSRIVPVTLVYVREQPCHFWRGWNFRNEPCLRGQTRDYVLLFHFKIGTACLKLRIRVGRSLEPISKMCCLFYFIYFFLAMIKTADLNILFICKNNVLVPELL